MFQTTSNWFSEHSAYTKIITYFVWVLIVTILSRLIRKILIKRLPNYAIKYKTQKGVEILSYTSVIVITISYFAGSIKDLGLALGLLTAGITIMLQELILSMAGSFYIFFLKVFKPSDRIEIHVIKGDVIDGDSLYTTMMEIGKRIEATNGTVKLASATFEIVKIPTVDFRGDGISKMKPRKTDS